MMTKPIEPLLRILCTALLFVSTMASAGFNEKVLDEIRSGRYNGKAMIQIRLERQLQYISHIRLQQGKRIEITLQAISGVKENTLLPEPPEHEYLRWKETQAIPLWQVEYLEENHEHRIILYFSRNVYVQVKSASDYKSLLITVSGQAFNDSLLNSIKKNPNTPPLSREDDKKLQNRLLSAQQAIIQSDFIQAKALLSQILLHSSNPYQQQALELSGIVEEKQGNFKSAIRHYQHYLELYPKGRDAVRVRQRLTSLLSAGKTPKKLKQAKKRKTEQWQQFGSIDQYFRYDQSNNGGTSLRVNRRALDTLVYYGSRYRSKELKVKTRFSGNLSYDTANSKNSFNSISNLYGKFDSKKWQLKSIVGRQTRNKGGVLGRIDGAFFSKTLQKDQALTLTMGYPVASTKDNVKTDKSLISLGYQWDKVIPNWQFSSYLLNQNNSLITDRRAIGGDFSYSRNNNFVFGMLDYDLLFSRLNLFTLSGNFSVNRKTSYNFSIDQRQTPWLYSSNAYAIVNNNTVNSLSQLKQLFGQDAIYQMAADHSAKTQTLLFGIDQTINTQVQLNGSITLTKQEATTASYGVNAIPGSGVDQFYDIHLTLNNLWQHQDVSLAGLRYSNTDNSNTLSLSLSTRFPANQHWRLNPRLNIDIRDHKNNTLVKNEWRLFPGFEARYRYSKSVSFDFDSGFSLDQRNLKAGSSEQDKYFYLSAGYRMEFF